MWRINLWIATKYYEIREWYYKGTRRPEWEVIAMGVSEPVAHFYSWEDADRFAWEQNRDLPVPKFSVHHNPRTIEQ